MEIYKYDTHVHTSEASGCASSTGAETALAYKEAGYDGIIITDHFFNGNSAVPRRLPWKKRIELFCKGYENAREQGEKIGLTVLFGWEFTSDANDFLTYGLDKEWLIAHPDIMDMQIWEYAQFVRRCGGFVVQAHPFRIRDYVKKLVLLPNDVDAVEAVNLGGNDIQNERARWYAESYGLPITGGSDTHNVAAAPKGGILTDMPINSISDYAEAVRGGRILKILDGKE